MGPEQRTQLNDFIGALNRRRQLGSPEDIARAQVPNFDQFPPQVQQSILDQLDIPDPMANAVFTVDFADHFRDAMSRMARDAGGRRGAMAREYADAVSGAARRQYPEYDQALNSLADMKSVRDAAAGTGRRYADNSEFLSTPPDVYGQTVANASTEPAAGRAAVQLDEAGNPPRWGDEYSSVGNALPDRDKEAVMWWTQGGHSGHMDPAMYTPEEAAQNIAIMRDLVSNNRSEGGVLWRAVSVDDQGRPLMSANDMASFTPDMDYAAQMGEELGTPYTLIRTEVPPGTQGFDIRNESGDVVETILPPGQFNETQRVPFGGSEVVEGSYEAPHFSASRHGEPTVSEADALRRRAAQDVRDAATSGERVGTVAKQLAQGEAQLPRNAALLGPERARRLQAGMQGEVDRVANTRFVDPRAGSQTFGRGQDAIVDGFISGLDDLATAKTGGMWGAVKLAAKWLKQGGIRNVDAERLSRDAMSEDPARVRSAIDFLEQRGMARQRATRFVNALGANLSGRAATAKEREVPQRYKPGSVRAITRNEGVTR